MDRYKLMWKITQRFGYLYDLRKVHNCRNMESFIIGCPIHKWVTVSSPSNFLRSDGCPKCSNDRRKVTWKEFLERANEHYNGTMEFTKPENFASKSIVHYKCLKCGMEGDVTSSILMRGVIHKSCVKGTNMLSHEKFLDRVKKAIGDEYDFSKATYNGVWNEVLIGCPKHGWFKAKPVNLFRGFGCRKCYDEKIHNSPSPKRLNTDEFISRAEAVHGKGRYEYVSLYEGAKKRISFKCKVCGHTTACIAENHLAGRGCRFCASSKMEQEAMTAMDKAGIKYVPQYRIGKQYLDFYLPEYNAAVECQGEQHLNEKFIFKRQNIRQHSLTQTISRDVKKAGMCKNDGITLFYYIQQEFMQRHHPLTDARFNGLYSYLKY